MELSGVGLMFTGLFTLTGDILLAGLASILAMMLIGSFEVRENLIWFRMMLTFTISYGFFFIMVIFGFITSKAFPSIGENLKGFLITIGFESTLDINQFFVGIGYNLVLWIMILTAFIVFGKRFIIVTRFISPQMVYLVLYLIALIFVLQLDLPDLAKYIAIFAVNILVYLASGPILTFLFGIKPLEDKRVERIIEEVQQKIQTPVRKVGIVNAPILNAFAYGPWFDQRIAYITSELDKFTDSEIRGITAHELAHVKRRHTLLLLGITAIELIIKAILNAPSNYWEYVLGSNTTWDFLSFWLFNISLFAVLLTFVKMLEGQADKITREEGFGTDLAESLYRLEGFYYGIAGEIGFNTQLMTGKTRTREEDIRFMGDEAFYLYKNLAPSRMTCFMNLIASHPLTSIRLSMQVDKSIGAIKAGFMIWFLLLPGLRKRTIKKLQSNHLKVAGMLSNKYSRDFGTIKEYNEITFEEAPFKYYIGHFVLAKSWLIDGEAHWGKMVGYRITEDIVSPIIFDLELMNGSTISIRKSDYSLIMAEPKHQYFTKQGKIVTLENIELKDGKFKKFEFSSNGKNFHSNTIGFAVKELENHQNWFVYKQGVINAWKLDNLEINESFQNSKFLFLEEDKKYEFTGKELVALVPPQFQMIYAKNWEKEKFFFKRLQLLKEPIILYDKEDIDIGAPCLISGVNFEDKTISIIENGKQRELNIKKIDAIVLDYPFYFLSFKKEMGFTNVLSLKLFNRGAKAKYIGV